MSQLSHVFNLMSQLFDMPAATIPLHWDCVGWEGYGAYIVCGHGVCRECFGVIEACWMALKLPGLFCCGGCEHIVVVMYADDTCATHLRCCMNINLESVVTLSMTCC